MGENLPGRNMYLIGLIITILSVIEQSLSGHLAIRTPKITIGSDSLDIFCEVTLSATLSRVTELQLFRNVSSVMKPIVTVKPLEFSPGTSIISWQDRHLQSRGTCTGDLDAKNPFLKFSIPKQHVHCDDARNYLCKMSGIKGEFIPQKEEARSFQPILCPSRFLKIHTPHPDITLGQSPLEIHCQIFKTANLYRIINIDLLRNSSKSYQNIFSVSSQINGLQSAIVWQDDFLQSRATASGDVSNLSAFLRFRIHPKYVTCADAATYTCRMTAMMNDLSTRYEEVTVDVATRAKPNSLDSLEVSPEADVNRKHRVGTEIQLMCSGIFGNPPEGLRWCFKRQKDTKYREYPLKSDITYSDAVSSAYCQYKRSSTLSFVVHREDEKADFMCEVVDDQPCGLSPVKARYRLLIHTNSSSGEESEALYAETEEDVGKLVAIGILTAICVILIVLLIVSIVLLCRCRKQNKEKEKKRDYEEKEPEKQPMFDHEKSGTFDRGDYRPEEPVDDYNRHSAV